MEHKVRIPRLIQRQLKGDLNAEEEAELAAWAETTAERKILLERLTHDEHLLSDLTDYGQQWGGSDGTKRFQRLSQGILERSMLVNVTKQAGITEKVARRIWRRYAAAAAMFLMAVGLGIWWYQATIQNPSQNPLASLEHVQPGGSKATLMTSDGQIVQLRPDQSGIVLQGTEWRYEDGEKLTGLTQETLSEDVWLTIRTPVGGTYQVTLGDGTKVWLNAASSLRYPVRFRGDQREVMLEGEGYFDVQHVSEQPFLVQTDRQTVEVLGTEFNVMSYPNETESQTTLVSGQVRLQEKAVPAGNQQLLSLIPGEQAVVANGQELIKRKVDVNLYIGWRDGLLVLKAANLGQIVRQLERWYDVEFIAGDGLDQERLNRIEALSGQIPRQANLSEILQVLTHNTGVKFKSEGRRIWMEK